MMWDPSDAETVRGADDTGISHPESLVSYSCINRNTGSYRITSRPASFPSFQAAFEDPRTHYPCGGGLAGDDAIRWGIKRTGYFCASGV
jgi:hypothetical protein